MRVLVLGVGLGGLELTSRLADEFGDGVEIVLIDQSDALCSASRSSTSCSGEPFPRGSGIVSRHREPGVQFVEATVRSIDPVAKRVETDAGRFEGDMMVVALGADLDLAATPGLSEAGHESTRSMAPSRRAMSWRASPAAA